MGLSLGPTHLPSSWWSHQPSSGGCWRFASLLGGQRGERERQIQMRKHRFPPPQDMWTPPRYMDSHQARGHSQACGDTPRHLDRPPTHSPRYLDPPPNTCMHLDPSAHVCVPRTPEHTWNRSPKRKHTSAPQSVAHLLTQMIFTKSLRGLHGFFF